MSLPTTHLTLSLSRNQRLDNLTWPVVAKVFDLHTQQYRPRTFLATLSTLHYTSIKWTLQGNVISVHTHVYFPSLTTQRTLVKFYAGYPRLTLPTEFHFGRCISTHIARIALKQFFKMTKWMSLYSSNHFKIVFPSYKLTDWDFLAVFHS
jgi:hypothetical protein